MTVPPSPNANDFPVRRFAALVLFVVSTGHSQIPHTASEEISPARRARTEWGVGTKLYDLTGGKSHWEVPTSLAGNPDLDHPFLAMAQPSRRLPLQLGGIGTGELSYRPWQLGLNGENGLWVWEPLHNLPDTPVTVLAWERFALSGNAFQLQFRRLLTDSIVIALDIVSHSVDSGGRFRYQDVTHQPYLSSIRRDSSRVPFDGRNLDMEHSHFLPSLQWHQPWGYAEIHASYLDQRGGDASAHLFERDTLSNFEIQFTEPAFSVRTLSNDYGLRFEITRIAGGRLQGHYLRGNTEMRYRGAPTLLGRIAERTLLVTDIDTTTWPPDTSYRDTVVLDTLWQPNAWENKLTVQRGELAWNAHTLPATPRLSVQWEHLQAQDYAGNIASPLYQRRSAAFLDLADSVRGIRGESQWGWQFNETATGKHSADPAFSTSVHIPVPGGWYTHAHWQYDHRYPDLHEQFFSNSARLYYPSTELRAEDRHRSQAGLGWLGDRFSTEIRYHFEWIHFPMVPGWVAFPHRDTLPLTQAFTLRNFDRAEHHAWSAQARFDLGNWSFWLERHSALERHLWLPDGRILDRAPHVAARYWKGGWQWSDRLVHGRMGVTTRWDFQWMGARQDYGISQDLGEDGVPTAVAVYLPTHLALDFEARMNIQRFDIFTRIENLNHSIYSPAAGYAPMGINFRYGITWYLGN